MNKSLGWVNPYSKSQGDILADLIKSLKVSVPEITDFSKANALIIILEAFAGIGEMISFNHDYMFRENFPSVAQKYTSMIALADKFNYGIKLSSPATTNLVINFRDDNGNLKALTSDFLIPKGTAFNNGEIVFITLYDYKALVGSTSITIPIYQLSSNVSVTIGETSGSDDDEFLIPEGACLLGLETYAAGEKYSFVENLSNSGSTDKHYTIRMKQDGGLYIRFGNNINGYRPLDGVSVMVSYMATAGGLGNVPAMTIVNSDLLLSNYVLEIYNPQKASGGFGVETMTMLRRNIPNSLHTLNRAVSLSDYDKLLQCIPGVLKSRSVYNRLSGVYSYIYPTGGGAISSELKSYIEEYMSDKVNLHDICISILNAGETNLVISVDVYLIGGSISDVVKSNIISKLCNTYSPANGYINREVYLSDIMSHIDGVSGVDHLKLKKLSYIPYFRPIQDSPELVVSGFLESLPSSNAWLVSYNGGEEFDVYKDGVYNSTQGMDSVWDIPGLSLYIPSTGQNTLSVGDSWTFTTGDIGYDILISDFTIPIFKPENITINTISVWN